MDSNEGASHTDTSTLSVSETPAEIFFTDFFEVSPEVLRTYGALNISLTNDLPLFVDPFLLFNSEREDYRLLHHQMIEYLRFLRDRAATGAVDEGLLKSWFTFSEVKQNWLGVSESGNAGTGLGPKFARALNNNLHSFFVNFGEENVTQGSHLEKLTLIESGIGRDNVSDFTTNLIKDFLLSYTQAFAQQYIDSERRRHVTVGKVRFNYDTQVWESKSFDLPWDGEDFVLLTPRNILTKDENWINRRGLLNEYHDIVTSVSNDQLRAQINNYFRMRLPENYDSKEEWEARSDVVRRFPELVELYIKRKEDNGDKASAYSDSKVSESEQLYIKQVSELVERLRTSTGFYDQTGNTYEEARSRVMYLKDVIENKGGHRFFFANGRPIRQEKELQLLFRLTWFNTRSDISSEVNDGRGPVDFKVSRGSFDKSLVEFKLASNSKLRRNLSNQVEIYKAASDAKNALKVILSLTDKDHSKATKILQDLGLWNHPDVILIDGRADNKPSGSIA